MGNHKRVNRRGDPRARGEAAHHHKLGCALYSAVFQPQYINVMRRFAPWPLRRPAGRGLMRLGGGLLLLVLIAAGLAFPMSGALAQTPPQPERCAIGFYLSDLYDIDTTARSFGADVYVWSRCPGERDALATADYLNAVDQERLLAWHDQTAAGRWSTIKLEGVYRQGFDVRNYPFDRHTLRIVVEEGVDDAETLLYVADSTRSRMRQDLDVQGWTLTGFRVESRPERYDTAFGDPALPADAPTNYSHLEMSVDVRRSDVWTFLQLSFPIFVATALALLTFLMHDENHRYLTPRLSLLAGVLFALVLNMRAATETVGPTNGLSLLDKMHLLALCIVLFAVVVAAAWRTLSRRGWPAARVERWDRRFLGLGGLAYIFGNVILVSLAAVAG